MAKRFKSKKGKIITLLNPSEKAKKFAVEIKNSKHYTNDRKVKRDKKGNPLKLTKAQKSYRAGYLDSRKDSSKAWNHNLKKKKAYNRSYKKYK